MSNARFGSTSWDEVEVSTNKERMSSRDRFLKLENGSNVVRIITKPHEYLVHRVKMDPKDPGFGERIMSSAFHGRDPVADQFNVKPKRRWLVGVVDRKTQSYKILDMSSQVFKGIQDLVRDEDWGDPSQYDIDIKVDKAAGPAAYYSVVPKSKKPLSPSDLELKQNVDFEDLKKRCTPPTPEDVEATLELLKKKRANVTKQTMNAVTNHVTEDDEFDFPSVEGSN